MKKRLGSILLALAMALTLIPVAPMRAESDLTPYTAYTCDGGSGGCWDDGAPANLVDNNTGTKWGADLPGNKYVDFHSAKPITPVGYVLTTGKDSKENPYRNPTSWNVYGKLNASDQWTLLDTVTNSDTPGAANFASYTFLLANPDTGKTWQYFRYEVTATHYVQGKPTTHVQLAEFQFLTGNVTDTLDLANATIEGVRETYTYTGEQIVPEYTVKTATGTVLKKGTDYRESFSLSPVVEAGEYTLTVTGIGSYKGTQSVTFSVDRSLRFSNFVYDACSGTCWGDSPASNLVDDNDDTKWGMAAQDVKYVDFHSKAPITPVGYILTTAADANENANRNPKSWTIYAKNEGDSGWTTLVTVSGDMTLGAVSRESYTFKLTNPGNKAWQYFRYAVSESRNGDQVALAEFRFLVVPDETDIRLATIEGVREAYAYTGAPIVPQYTVKTPYGKVLTRGRDYTESFTPSSVRAIGDYTLTVTGIGSYKGTQSATFSVVAPVVAAKGLKNGDRVCFVDYSNDCIWRVLSPAGEKKLETSGEDRVLVIFDYNMVSGPFGASNVWAQSSLKAWCAELYANTVAHYVNKLRPVEKSAIAPTSVTETDNFEYRYDNGGYQSVQIYGPASLNGEYFFMLSAKEVDTYFDGRYDRGGTYWTRSPSLKGGSDTTSKAGYVNGFGELDEYHVGSTVSRRPACNLDASRILFVSARGGGKAGDAGVIGAIPAIPASTPQEYKLTLLDDSRKDFAVTEKSVTATAGGAFSLRYQNAKTGDNEHVSVLLYDAAGTPAGYGGSAPLTNASGTVSFSLPIGLAPGSYKLQVFNEQRSAGNGSDCASPFREVALTVRDLPVPTLTVSDIEKTYDGKAAHVKGTATADGAAVAGTWSFSGAQSFVNVADSGVKTVVFTPTDTERYAPAMTTITLTINRRGVTVKADDKAKLQGWPDPELTATVTGLVGADTVEYTLSRGEGENLGRYAIEAFGREEQGNYAVTFKWGGLWIKQLDLAFKAAGADGVLRAYVQNAPVGSQLLAARYEKATGKLLDVRCIPVTATLDTSASDAEFEAYLWSFPPNQLEDTLRQYTYKLLLVDGKTFVPYCPAANAEDFLK
jgi:hypothetical protein